LRSQLLALWTAKLFSISRTNRARMSFSDKASHRANCPVQQKVPSENDEIQYGHA
jgi:hypothetical protein